MDVDGVLTDGSVQLDGNGNESKRVSFADIMGVSIGRKAGLLFALVSGEDGPTLDQIARKFGIDDVYRGCKDKAAALRDYARRRRLNLADICFVGDDVNDVPAMELAGSSCAPASAHPAALKIAALVTAKPGGSGAVRELIDGLLATRA
jgi:3-deoxy-D-manno-octulosonate 8-phosphate phosphatase (KDO 8-P phosphatase)